MKEEIKYYPIEEVVKRYRERVNSMVNSWKEFRSTIKIEYHRTPKELFDNQNKNK